jgi:hypothetical protein
MGVYNSANQSDALRSLLSHLQKVSKEVVVDGSIRQRLSTRHPGELFAVSPSILENMVIDGSIPQRQPIVGRWRCSIPTKCVH